MNMHKIIVSDYINTVSCSNSQNLQAWEKSTQTGHVHTNIAAIIIKVLLACCKSIWLNIRLHSKWEQNKSRVFRISNVCLNTLNNWIDIQQLVSFENIKNL